tara:strand:+ start:199 stop:1125 length:927 start_codon:yes stop_codon:yes gene_type:complete
MARTRDLNRNLSSIARILARVENRFLRELIHNHVLALRDIQDELQRIYAKHANGEGELTKSEMTKYNRLRNLEKQSVGILEEHLGKNVRVLNGLKAEEFNQAFFRTSWAIDQNAGVGIRWGTMNPEAVKAAVANPLDKIGMQGAKQFAKLGIRRTITQGIIQGKSFPNMARDLRGLLERSASGYIRIARTEGQRAQVLGQQESYDRAQEQGVDLNEVWDATLDDRVRKEHAALDGQQKTEEGFWVPSLGRHVPGPLQSGVASFDINCRCRVRAVIEGFEPEFRRIRGEGIVPYQSFNQWDKARKAAAR